MAQSKYWCFTLNNYNATEEENLRAFGLGERCSYLIFGREVGASETPHLQGYLELINRSRMATLKNRIGITRIHLEKRRGTPLEASEYCKKEGDFEVFGVISESNQGRRSDLQEVVDLVNQGGTLRDLWQEHTATMIRYSRGIREAMVNLRPLQEHRTFDLDSFAFHPLVFPESRSIIIWGESGARKTSYVTSRFPRILMVSHMDDLLNFREGEHEGILFDDMDFRHTPRTAQIHLTDQDFDRSIHIRYTTVTIPRKTIKIFTTNEQNGAIFMDDPAINRRLHKIHIITSL